MLKRANFFTIAFILLVLATFTYLAGSEDINSPLSKLAYLSMLFGWLQTALNNIRK